MRWVFRGLFHLFKIQEERCDAVAVLDPPDDELSLLMTSAQQDEKANEGYLGFVGNWWGGAEGAQNPPFNIYVLKRFSV